MLRPLWQSEARNLPAKCFQPPKPQTNQTLWLTRSKILVSFPAAAPQMNLNLRLELVLLEQSSEPTSMRDMQAHARKIRSDAAECLVLSNLVSEERRPLFARIAEHLNSLALEIETEGVTGVADKPSALPDQQVNFVDRPAALSDPQRAPRSWRLLPGALLVVLVIIGAGVLWAMNRTELSIAKLLQTTGSELQAPVHELTTVLSEEKADRKAFREQLDGLMTRLDSLTKEIDHLKSSRAGAPTPPTSASLSSEDQTPGAEAKPPAQQDTATAAGSTSPPTTPATGTTASAPANSSTASESSDQVGAISAPRTEPESNARTIGPAGCTRFRSFDPVSGTYTTFDGRRRQCRQP